MLGERLSRSRLTAWLATQHAATEDDDDYDDDGAGRCGSHHEGEKYRSWYWEQRGGEPYHEDTVRMDNQISRT